MRPIKASKNKKVYTLGRAEWLSMGKKAGWLKKSKWDGYYPEEPEPKCPECGDVMSFEYSEWKYHCSDCKIIFDPDDNTYEGAEDDYDPDDRDHPDVQEREWAGQDLPGEGKYD